MPRFMILEAFVYLNSFTEEELQVAEGVKKALDKETSSIPLHLTLMLLNLYGKVDEPSLASLFKYVISGGGFESCWLPSGDICVYGLKLLASDVSSVVDLHD